MKRDEQHTLSSRHLDELRRWKPPVVRAPARPVRRELDGQLDLVLDELRACEAG